MLACCLEGITFFGDLAYLGGHCVFSVAGKVSSVICILVDAVGVVGMLCSIVGADRILIDRSFSEGSGQVWRIFSFLLHPPPDNAAYRSRLIR